MEQDCGAEERSYRGIARMPASLAIAPALDSGVSAGARQIDENPGPLTRGERPDVWQSRYIHECHHQTRWVVTWPVGQPQNRSYRRACCYSWRHRGECQSARFCEDRDRIALALKRYDPDDLVYLVATYDPKQWDAGGFRPSRALDPEKRARVNHAQISKMFRGLYESWGQFYMGKAIRSTGRRTGIRDQMECSGYVGTAEVQSRGWPHLNVILVAPGLAKRVREVTAKIAARMPSWDLYDAWTPKQRRSMLLKLVAEEVCPTLRDSGFGRCSLEPVQNAGALAAYIAKLALNEELPADTVQRDPDSNVISAEFAKMTQVPYRAPKGFRRLRSSRGFLPPLPRPDGTRTGCIVSQTGQLVAGVDYPERERQARTIVAQVDADHSFGQLAQGFDEAEAELHASVRAAAAGRLKTERPSPLQAQTMDHWTRDALDSLGPDIAIDAATGVIFDVQTGEYVERATPVEAQTARAKRDGSDREPTVVAAEQLESAIRKRKGEPEPGPWWQWRPNPPPSQATKDEFRWLLGSEARRRAVDFHPDMSEEAQAWQTERAVLRDDREWAAQNAHAVEEVAAIVARGAKHEATGRYLETHARILHRWEAAEFEQLWLRLRSPEERQRELEGLERSKAADLQDARRLSYLGDQDQARTLSQRAAQTQALIDAGAEASPAPTAEQRAAMLLELRFREARPLHRESYVIRSTDPRCEWREVVPREVLELERPEPSTLAGLL